VISGDPETARPISADKALQPRGYAPQHTFALLDALTAMADAAAVIELLPHARRLVVGNALLGPAADRAEGLALLAHH
jgi:hypothetical protein